jgi:sterol desaturase/sphingolipid hydroxylase (fatty acid hydroxylase superfamily)
MAPVASFAVLAFGFFLVFGGVRCVQYRLGRGTPLCALDLAYWVFTPLVTGTLTRAVTWAVVGLGAGSPPTSPGTISALPFAVQMALAVVVSDLVGTLSHRLRHTRALWPFHVLHHTPRVLDALAAARMHPMDDVIDNVIVGVTVILCGFDDDVIVLLGPLLMVHTIYLHADLPFRHGPLRFVFASPVFHREHHRRLRDEPPCNFAQVFSAFDLLLGTFRLPAEEPSCCGVDEEVPEHLGAHLLWPYRALFASVEHTATGATAAEPQKETKAQRKNDDSHQRAEWFRPTCARRARATARDA